MRRLALLLALLAAAPSAQAAEQRIYSYDAADQKTRELIGSGLTFVFDKGLLAMRVKEILSTEARASIFVDPVGEKELGVRLDRLLPPADWAGDIYRIADREQGPGMVRAFCSGSSKGWLIMTPLKANRRLIVHAVGDDPSGGPPRLCATLRFAFRGEWTTPPAIGVMPNMSNLDLWR